MEPSLQNEQEPGRKAGLSRARPHGGTALLLIDWINDFGFDEGEQLFEHAIEAAHRTARLKRRAREAGLPIVYVNDNFGHWRSDFRDIVQHCEKGRGRDVVEQLRPERDDYFILKPKHSGFFHTPLELLLDDLGVSRVLLTGLAGNICVLFTAHDAHMRDLDVVVVEDCVASNTEHDNRCALEQLAKVVHAEVKASDDLELG